MRTALDTNVLSALWSGAPASAKISASLAEARRRGGLVVCAPVYIELLAYPSASARFVEDFLGETAIAVDLDLDEAIWRFAGTAFATYAQRRRRSGGGSAKRLLADFLIASHASLRADRLMTLDTSRYRQDFPKLHLV